MGRDQKTRDAASEAVIAMRTQLGQSQQRFAEQTLKSSIMTVSRYEGRFPPRGEALLRLAEIADKNDLAVLAGTFRKLYLEDVQKTLGFSAIIIPETDTEPPQEWQIQKLEGMEEMFMGRICHEALRSLRSPNEAERKIAKTAMRRVYDELRAFKQSQSAGDLIAFDIGFATLAAASKGEKNR